MYNNLSMQLSYTMAGPSGYRFWGGSFEALPGSTLAYQWYRSNTTFDWQIDTAMQAWDDTATNLQLSRSATNNGTKFNFYPANYNQGWLGLTTIYPCPGNSKPVGVAFQCFYGHAQIDLDIPSLNSVSDNQKRKVAGHEAGHALGLWHPPSGSTSMMNQGLISGGTPMTPTAYDVANTQTLYPNSSWETP